MRLPASTRFSASGKLAPSRCSEFDQVIAQRFAIVEEGETVAISQIGEPARIEQAVAQRPIERDGAIDVQRAIVRAQPRVLQQRRGEDQADNDQ